MARTSRIADLKIQWQIAYTKEDWIRTANIERILRDKFATGEKVLRDLETWRVERERKELEAKKVKEPEPEPTGIQYHDREAGGTRCKYCGSTSLEILWGVSERAELVMVPDPEAPKQKRTPKYFSRETGAKVMIEAWCADCNRKLIAPDQDKIRNLFNWRA